MGIVFNPVGAFAEEVRKWEQHDTKYAMTEEGSFKPGHPYEFRPYPRMIYKAFKRENGKVLCMENAPDPWGFRSPGEYEHAILRADSFNRSCQLVVHSEEEYQRERGHGWRDTPTEALAYYEALEQDIGNAAAEAAAASKRMTATAQREHAVAEASTHEHVVDVVGQKHGEKPAAVTTAKR